MGKNITYDMKISTELRQILKKLCSLGDCYKVISLDETFLFKNTSLKLVIEQINKN